MHIFLRRIAHFSAGGGDGEDGSGNFDVCATAPEC
jgi:hypothetical protein